MTSKQITFYQKKLFLPQRKREDWTHSITAVSKILKMTNNIGFLISFFPEKLIEIRNYIKPLRELNFNFAKLLKIKIMFKICT